ncbi:MAG: leucine-rich repeat domain-containing protein [Bacteroidota bacterium]
MEEEYEYKLFNIENDVQDRSSDAWKKLCEYVEIVAESGQDEFSPLEFLGAELVQQIHSLPESIAKLKKVEKVWLYVSQLKRIPPKMGEMESLEYFDPYTSYHLHWFPYEITNCKKLKDSRVSTRALYGNRKYRRPFPDLRKNPVRYQGGRLNCSICQKEMMYSETNQWWISLKVGTDILPLLVNVCSESCKKKIPTPPKDYIQHPHKGGVDLMQAKRYAWGAPNSYTIEELREMYKDAEGGRKESRKRNAWTSKLSGLRLIRKIWES